MIKHKFALLFASACLSLAAALPASAQTRILPLGDSVTSSYVPHSSFRYWLWHALVDHGFTNIDFVGRQHGVYGGDAANPDFDQDHEGHPGWTSQDGLNEIDAIASATQPDIVLLDLGSNDIEDDMPLDTTVANLEAIIDHLRAFNPNVTVLMAEPTPYQGQDGRAMSMLNSAIKKIAKLENQPGSKVIAVNLSSGFNVRKDTFDGMHPNESGEQKISKKYYSVLKRLLH